MNKVIACFGMTGGFIEFVAGLYFLINFLLINSNGFGVLGSIILLFLGYSSSMSSVWAYDNWKNK